MIEVKKGFVLRKGKVYPLLREKREEVREFIREQLRKGYIWPLKLLQIVPVFFIGKKDRKKRMVQDYRYLNEWMIKNNYPLPLISDVLENISVKFTNGRLSFSLFYFSFLFSFQFIFLFSIFRTTRVRADWSCHHISHNLIA